MGILKGLESLGLGNLSDIDLLEDKKDDQNKKAEQLKEEQLKKEEALKAALLKKEELKKAEEAKKAEMAAKAAKVVDEASLVFDKTYKCPVCDKGFKCKTVKTGKARLISQDIDLRPVFHDIDSLKYEIVACPFCGYASLPRTFEGLPSPHAKLVRERISASFTGLKGSRGETYSYDDAIERGRLALVNAVVKRSKLSERGYICLQLAWLLRGKRVNLPADTPDRDNLIEQLKADENEMLSNAKEFLMTAFSQERMPLYTLDEPTAIYVIAALSAETGDSENALRWASRLITSKNASERIKERARVLKEKITNGEF